jgi:hypothetical protein
MKHTPPDWIRELKPGDKFLDESLEYFGTVVKNENSFLNWYWTYIETGVSYGVVGLEHSDIYGGIYGGWVRPTPLLEALL